MTTVLITGASGFLGTHFLDWFMRSPDDYDLWPMDIKPHPRGIPYDLMDMGQWLEDFNVDVDLVIHMAAPVGGREKIEGDPLYNADSLRLDSLLFRWAIKHAKTVLFPSSSAVYGTSLQGDDASPLYEEQFNPSNDLWWAPDEMYGFTKMAGERLAWSAAKYGLNTLCIRPFSGYGEGQSFEYPTPSIARRALHLEDPIEVWGPGTQTRDFVHVDDLIAITMARLSAGVLGYQSMNIGSGTETSFNDIARICAELVATNPHANILERPYQPRIVNLGDKPMGVHRRYADTSIQDQYLHPKIKLREGLARVLDFIREQEAESNAQDA